MIVLPFAATVLAETWLLSRRVLASNRSRYDSKLAEYILWDCSCEVMGTPRPLMICLTIPLQQAALDDRTNQQDSTKNAHRGPIVCQRCTWNLHHKNSDSTPFALEQQTLAGCVEVHSTLGTGTDQQCLMPSLQVPTEIVTTRNKLTPHFAVHVLAGGKRVLLAEGLLLPADS